MQLCISAADKLNKAGNTVFTFAMKTLKKKDQMHLLKSPQQFTNVIFPAFKTAGYVFSN